MKFKKSLVLAYQVIFGLNAIKVGHGDQNILVCRIDPNMLGLNFEILNTFTDEELS